MILTIESNEPKGSDTTEGFSNGLIGQVKP